MLSLISLSLPKLSIDLLLMLTLFGCLAHAGTQSNPSSAPASGLEGSIFLHTIEGGPVKKGAPDSKSLADTTFVVRQGDLTVTSFTTDKQGSFRVSLPPGHYSISKKDWNSRVGFYGPFEVDITAGHVKKVQWHCDTGME